MSQEIVEAVRALAREKGISEEKLITALEVSSPGPKYRRQSTMSETKEPSQ